MAKKTGLNNPTPRANVTLANFLIKLAIDKELRDAYSANPEATIDGFQPALDVVANAALKERSLSAIFEKLDVNQQSTGGGGVITTGATKGKTAKKAKKARKTAPGKTAAKKASKKAAKK